MFRVRKSLKLTRTGSIPFAKRFIFISLFQNSRQKLRLGRKTFRCQPGGFTGSLDGRKIDVGRDVLFAGVGEKVAGNMLAKIGAQGAMRDGLGKTIRRRVNP